FQAEDGIRDFHVTGVQTCALPIWSRTPTRQPGPTVWAEVEGRVRMTRWERRAALLVGVLGLGVAAVGCGAPERQAGTMLGPEGTVEADTESGPAATTP